MDEDRARGLRNVGILLLLAVVVWRVPGGGTGANVLGDLITLILFGGLAFLAYRQYMEHRFTLMAMDDRSRAVLYGCLGAAGLLLVATSRMWDAGPGFSLLWIAAVAGAAYGVWATLRDARSL